MAKSKTSIEEKIKELEILLDAKPLNSDKIKKLLSETGSSKHLFSSDLKDKIGENMTVIFNPSRKVEEIKIKGCCGDGDQTITIKKGYNSK